MKPAAALITLALAAIGSAKVATEYDYGDPSTTSPSMSMQPLTLCTSSCSTSVVVPFTSYPISVSSAIYPGPGPASSGTSINTVGSSSAVPPPPPGSGPLSSLPLGSSTGPAGPGSTPPPPPPPPLASPTTSPSGNAPTGGGTHPPPPLTMCPPGVTCSGQTTTWTGNVGPTPCATSGTCTAVMPSTSPATANGACIAGVGTGRLSRAVLCGLVGIAILVYLG